MIPPRPTWHVSRVPPASPLPPSLPPPRCPLSHPLATMERMCGWMPPAISTQQQLMNVWLIAFQSVAEVRAAGTRGPGEHSSHADGIRRESADAGGEGLGLDWWDDVSHQAQRVAHVTAASAFACGGGEVRDGIGAGGVLIVVHAVKVRLMTSHP